MDLSCGPKFSRALVILNLVNIKINLSSSKKINKIRSVPNAFSAG